MFNIAPRPSDPFILLVEDNRKEMETIKNYLAQSGVLRNHLSTCRSISETIQFLSEHPKFSILLLDLSIMDGIALTGINKILTQFPDKIIIALAAKKYQHLGVEVVRSGAMDFLIKEELNEENLYQTICFAIERKQQTEHQLFDKLSRVKQNNHLLYQNIFNNSKDAIYICNLEGHFVDFNQSTFELFAFSEEELTKIDVHDLFQPREKKKEFLYALVAHKSVMDFPIEIEQKNGRTRHCLISATMIETTDFTGYSGVLRDVTEKLKLEELRKARDIARQSAKMKEQFIANISHEMRTPMNAILGMSNLVAQTELTKEQKAYINSIQQSSEILLGVVNDVLAISEIQNSQLKFDNKFFNVHELLHNLMNVMQYQAMDKHLELFLHLGEDIPKIISGDKLRLNQILYNLLGNAIKFTKKGSIRIIVENLNESNNFVQLKFTVSDTGIGIPSDKIDAVFETFTRVREHGKTEEGTGLGLPIAKNLVEQQGGKIGVFSTVGKGSNFFFDLVFEIGEEVMPEPIQAKATATLNKGAIRLLLVEDHKMNQLVAIKTLEKHWSAIEIEVANDGNEAIALLEKKKFDVILMDIQMPNKNGYETTAYIRHKMPPKIAEIPILAMTAHAHVAKNEKFREYGMDDCILKPFEPKELFRKITEYTFKYKVMV